MRVFACLQSNDVGKFRGVIESFPKIWEGTVLDVGCRSGKLKHLLCEPNPSIRYVGLDLYSPANVIANLEKGLPFGEKTFDVVVALDVLEHTDDIHTAFDELCRVTRQFVVITLPNAFELRGRIKLLFGRPLSGKYRLCPDPPPDRHRWLFSLNDARTFVHTRARRCGFEIKDEGCLIGPRRASRLGPLVGCLPNLLSPWYLVLLGRS